MADDSWSDDDVQPQASKIVRAIGRGRGRLPNDNKKIGDVNSNTVPPTSKVPDNKPIKATAPANRPGDKATAPANRPGDKATAPANRPGDKATAPANRPGDKATAPANRPGDKATAPANRPGDKAPNLMFGVEQDNEMLVPKHMVGRIIGRAGCKIKEIREESGARIDISDEGFDSRVTLTGNPAQVAKAREIIKAFVEEQSAAGSARRVELESMEQLADPYDSDDPLILRPRNEGIPAHWGVMESEDEDEFGPNEEENTVIDWAALRNGMAEAEVRKWAHCDQIVKDLYKEKDSVKNKTEEEVSVFREMNNCIQVKNFNPEDKTPLMNPVTTFEEAYSDYPDIMETIRNQGFEKPSPIQCQIWPYLLMGRDVIGIAQTGTGKTLGFLLPAFIHIEAQPTPRGKRDGANVLIFAPTRELAQQISQEVKKYEYRGIRSVCVYGGGNIGEQLRAIEKGVEIIIATPGRFNHFVEKGSINLSSITYLVLDEADRMLDAGFEYEIRKTLIDIRPDRLTVMTSATWPPDVRRLADKYMVNPATVFVGSLDLAAVHSVTQEIIQVEEEEKQAHLLKFLRSMEKDDKVIVFGGRKSTVTKLSIDLVFEKISCQSIHGDRAQEDREEALQDLRSGEVRILIATDVASRGIDIQDVTHVYNFDFPRDMEEYVHRIGRTGRAGKTGKSISLFTKQDWRKSPELVGIMEEANQDVPEWLKRESIRFKAWKERKAEQEKEFGGRSGGRGGGGGRSGGGRGGGGSGCHNCGENGHFSRECPSGGGGGRGGGRGRGGRGGGGGGCFKCGEHGHISRECRK